MILLTFRLLFVIFPMFVVCDVDLNIGFLPDVKEGYNYSIYTGAITNAMKKVNEDPTLLPDIKVNVIPGAKVIGHPETGAKSAVDLIVNNGSRALFGPGTPCYVEASISAGYNVPIFSYVSTQYTFLAMRNDLTRLFI